MIWILVRFYLEFGVGLWLAHLLYRWLSTWRLSWQLDDLLALPLLALLWPILVAVQLERWVRRAWRAISA